MRTGRAGDLLPAQRSRRRPWRWFAGIFRITWVMPMTIISPRSSRGAEPVANAATGDTASLFVAGRRQKSLEFGLLILAIVVAAAVIWGVVRLALPGGTAPSAGIAGSVSAPIEQSGSARTPLPNFEGSIAKIHRTVQMRAGSELAWSGAELGRAVHTEDAIQTLAEASVVVQVKDRGDISIGENSLVVFEANANDTFMAAGTAVASVTHGVLKGRLKAGADNDVLGIRLPNATVRLQGVSPGQAADFNLQVNRDKSASIVIVRGKAQVRARNGVTKLGSGEGIQISADGGRAERQSIPAAPVLVEPVANQVIVYHKEPPKVLFRWQSGTPVDDYHFVLAKDRDLRDTIADEHLSDGTYIRADLRSGDYYWKVTARRGWLDGASTSVAVVHVERDIDGQVRDALTELYQQSEGARTMVANAKGVLVFPHVIKGGLILGGEYGEGALSSGGSVVGYYTMKLASLGLQIGAQRRKVILLFMTSEAYDGFVKSSAWKVGVDGSVTVAGSGPGKAIDMITAQKPIIGFVFSNEGLMFNLTLEGSKISRMPD
jgi:lipid-binding SYLF domain-containing protein